MPLTTLTSVFRPFALSLDKTASDESADVTGDGEAAGNATGATDRPHSGLRTSTDSGGDGDDTRSTTSGEYSVEMGGEYSVETSGSVSADADADVAVSFEDDGWGANVGGDREYVNVGSEREYVNVDAEAQGDASANAFSAEEVCYTRVGLLKTEKASLTQSPSVPAQLPSLLTLPSISVPPPQLYHVVFSFLGVG